MTRHRFNIFQYLPGVTPDDGENVLFDVMDVHLISDN